MAQISAQVPYNPTAGITAIQPTATPEQNVRATPEDMGAAVGAGMESAGQKGEAVATDWARNQMETHVENTYANIYAPAAANLRANFDKLRDQDKVEGYDKYISDLQDLNKGIQEQYESSPYGQKIISQLIGRHVQQEIDGAKRELIPAQMQASDDANFQMRLANQKEAVDHYDNPPRVNQLMQQNDGLIEKNAIGKGQSVDGPEVEDAKRAMRGDMAVGMIKAAVGEGRTDIANQLRAASAKYIPGWQRLQLDGILQEENTRQTTFHNMNALVGGQPLPEAVGKPPVQVRADVARAAQQSNVDPNTALTYVSIESANGRNVGARGTLQQDTLGGTYEEQVARLPGQIAHNEQVASKAVGRAAEPWEGYAVHQQGDGGGSALLADAQKPLGQQQRAIDLLRPFEEKEKGYDAKKAIIDNGGNVTMTSGQFLQHIHETWQHHYSGSEIQLAQNEGQMNDAGAAILAPHQATGPAVQSGGDAISNYRNYTAARPDLLARIQAIPGVQERTAQFAAEERYNKFVSESASAQRTQLVDQAMQLANNPKFTSMHMAPPEMIAAVARDAPQSYHVMEALADYNAKKAGGQMTEDMKKWGPGAAEAFQRITSDHQFGIQDLQAMVLKPGEDPNTPGKLTIEGYDHMLGEMTNNKNPETQAKSKMKDETLKVVKNMVSFEGDYGIKDPHGEENYASLLPAVFKAMADGEAKGIPDSELYDPKSKDWAGNAARAMVKERDDRYAELAKANLFNEQQEENKPGWFLRQAHAVGSFNLFGPNFGEKPAGDSAQVETQLKSGALKGDEGAAALKQLYATDPAKAKELAMQYGYIKKPEAVQPEAPKAE